MPENIQFSPEEVADKSRQLAQALILNTIALLHDYNLSAVEWFSAGRHKYVADWEYLRGQSPYDVLRGIALNATAIGATVESLKNDNDTATLILTNWPDPWFLNTLGLTVADTNPFWEALRSMIEYLGFHYEWQRDHQHIILRVTSIL